MAATMASDQQRKRREHVEELLRRNAAAIADARQTMRELRHAADRSERIASRLACAIKGHIIADRSTGCYQCKRCHQFVWYPCRVDRLR